MEGLIKTGEEQALFTTATMMDLILYIQISHVVCQGQALGKNPACPNI